MGTVRPRPDSLFADGGGCPATSHELHVLGFSLAWDFICWDVRLRELASFFPAVPFGMESWAHDDSVQLDSLVDAFPLERLLPRFTFLHFELGNLVVVDELVVLLATSFVILSISLAFSSASLLGIICLAGCSFCGSFIVEVGWKCDIEAV